MMIFYFFLLIFNFLAEKRSNIWANRGEKLSEFSNFLSKVFVDTFEGIQVASCNNNQFKKRIISTDENVCFHF